MADDQVTTNEIMEFLQEQMVTHEELCSELQKSQNQQKLEILDAVDEKILNLKADITVLMRGEDRKLSILVELLRNKEVISQEEAQSILKLQPFPQM